MAVDANTGGWKWDYKTEAIYESSPAISGGLVFVGSDDGYVYAFKQSASTSFPISSPIKATGTVSIASFPSGASIYLDGVYKGITPIMIDEVSPVVHKIELKIDGYKPWSEKMDIRAGNITNVSVILEVEKALPSKTPIEDLPLTPIAAAAGTTAMVGVAATLSGGYIFNRISNYLIKFDEMFKEFLKIGGEFALEEVVENKFGENKEKGYSNSGEFKRYIIGGGILFLAFAISPQSHAVEYNVDQIVFLFALAFFAMFAQIGHNLAFKFFLRSAGIKSVFKLSPIGVIITVLSGAVGFLITVVGGTKILHDFDNPFNEAMATASGSLFNLLLGAFLLFVGMFMNIEWIALAGAMPNLVYATFCLFPTYPFEGRRVFEGNKFLWGLLFFFSLMFYFIVLWSPILI